MNNWLSFWNDWKITKQQKKNEKKICESLNAPLYKKFADCFRNIFQQKLGSEIFSLNQFHLQKVNYDKVLAAGMSYLRLLVFIFTLSRLSKVSISSNSQTNCSAKIFTFCNARHGLLHNNQTCYYIDSSLKGADWATQMSQCKNVAISSNFTSGRLANIDTEAKWNELIAKLNFSKNGNKKFQRISVWNKEKHIVFNVQTYGLERKWNHQAHVWQQEHRKMCFGLTIRPFRMHR